MQGKGWEKHTVSFPLFLRPSPLSKKINSREGLFIHPYAAADTFNSTDLFLPARLPSSSSLLLSLSEPEEENENREIILPPREEGGEGERERERGEGGMRPVEG